MLDIYIDADACPVKSEVYKVADRCSLSVLVVSNTPIHVPARPARISNIAVGPGIDAADDWIAENIGAGDICITADIPLASRCIKLGAFALGPRGKPFTEDSIGDALATRELMSSLRDSGQISGGPPPMTKKDRSRFLDALDQIIQKIRREMLVK
ncbi:MAG: YaiI/YqxD family protein [Deltaproteobacteria bacterium]|nr:YaiI/YqxD family protein [Deltaproteobacteria bacterium]